MVPKVDEYEDAIASFKTSSIKSIVAFQKNDDNGGTEVKGGCSKQEIQQLHSKIFAGIVTDVTKRFAETMTD